MNERAKKRGSANPARTAAALSKTRRAGGLGIAAALAFVALSSVSASWAGDQRSPQSVAAVFQELRKMNGFQADFQEEKHLALLKAPLKSSGKLYYLSPGHLVRKVTSPEPMTISVARGVVTIKDAQGTKKMDLSSRPGVAAFVESFAHFLDGNEQELKKHFQLHYEVGEKGFRLQLSPRKAPLNQVVKHITMSGQGTTVRELLVQETNGDKSVTRLSAVDTRKQFSAQEKKNIFGQ